MSSEADFDLDWRIEKYHSAIDDWGFAKGTRLWMSSSDYKPVQEIEKGDKVFGIGYRLEDEYVEKKKRPDDPTENIEKYFRPVIVEREVLGVETVQARAWQLTFGHEEKMFKARRLVAGAQTPLRIFPLAHDIREAKPLANCHTAVENPRMETDRRRALKMDPERSRRAGEPKKQPTEFTGTPRGESAIIIPHLAYLGQVNVLSNSEDRREYPRYVCEQVREIIPLMDPGTTLYQIYVQPDTGEELGVVGDMAPRSNVIAQTPFAPDKEETVIQTDRASREFDRIGKEDVEEFNEKWDEYWENRGDPQVTEGPTESRERRPSGHYYETKHGEKGEALSKLYDIEDGFLNGGILMDLPAPPQYTENRSDPAVARLSSGEEGEEPVDTEEDGPEESVPVAQSH